MEQPHAHRLEFLDALRGVAALSVAFSHRAAETIDNYQHFDTDVFRAGQFGVVLFFLCSGFIIPASLERYDALRPFWISRFFRLFPLYWVALAAFLVLYAVGIYDLPGDYVDSPVVSTLANLTMVQAFMREPLGIGLSWTLAFEMFFYLIISTFFVASVHRKSLSIAAPAVGVVLSLGLENAGEPRPLVAVALLVTSVLGIRLLLASPTMQQRSAFIVVAILAAIVLFNGYSEAWYAAVLLTTMFVGTVLFRWTSAEQPPSRVLGLFLAAAVVAVSSCAINGDKPAIATSVGAAYALFGLALWQRHRHFPRPIVQLGLISYSVYLLHPIGYAILGNALNEPLWRQMAMLAGGLVFALALSTLSYRYLERPFIRMGHRLATARSGRPISRS